MPFQTEEEEKREENIIRLKQCSVGGCQVESVIHIQLRTGREIRRCSRHYMNEVDHHKRGLCSKILNEHLKRELDEMLKIGLHEYRNNVIKKLRDYIGG